MPEAHNLLKELIAEIETVSIARQLLVIAVCVLLAWLVQRALQPRLDRARENVAVEEEAFRVGAGGISRVLFPISLWLLLLIARYLFQGRFAVNLLNIAIPLSSSLVIIRIAVYLLRRVFSPSGWLRSSERAIAWTMWAGAALYITGALPYVREWLDSVVLPFGKHPISLLNIIEGTVSVLLTILVAMWIGRLLEGRVMALAQMDINLRVVISKALKAVFLVIAVLIALPLVGIDVTVLSVFGGAIGVGLGFGLQKIAANYLSGFAILLDRSIRLGDLVTIDQRYGEVSRLTARYVVVKGMDGTESIIPNETVITSTVLNHSYSDRVVRVDVAVQVAYGTDLRKALELLLSTAKANPRVLQTPGPIANVKALGESGIDIDFLVWIADPEQGRGNLKSDLLIAIAEAFHVHGITIPFPQRDIRIVSAEPDITAQVQDLNSR